MEPINSLRKRVRAMLPLGQDSSSHTYDMLSQSSTCHAASTSPSEPQVGQMNTRSTGIPSNARKTAFRFFLADRGSVDSPSSVPASSEGPVSGFWLGIASTNIRSVLLSIPVRRANFLSVFLLAHIIHRRPSPKLFPVVAALLELISASSDWRQSSH